MRRTSILLAMLAACGGALAQETPSEGLTLRVSPSGYDTVAAEARAREARLQQRMREADFLFRNICRQCGGGTDRPGSNAPFNPIETLGRPTASVE